eukprot:COSAG02_NODE_9015_length_2359_cov_43.211062_2_plen_190_part_00
MARGGARAWSGSYECVRVGVWVRCCCVLNRSTLHCCLCTCQITQRNGSMTSHTPPSGSAASQSLPSDQKKLTTHQSPIRINAIRFSALLTLPRSFAPQDEPMYRFSFPPEVLHRSKTKAPNASLSPQLACAPPHSTPPCPRRSGLDVHPSSALEFARLPLTSTGGHQQRAGSNLVLRRRRSAQQQRRQS